MNPHPHFNPEESDQPRLSFAQQARELAMRAIFGERHHAVTWTAAHAEQPYIADADRTLFEPNVGLFGVFDGVGHTGAPAAEAAAQYVRAHDSEFISPRELARVLVEASGTIYRNPDTHDRQTTATVAKLTPTDSGADVVWASAGDTRLYLIGLDGQVEQVSRDEGRGNVIDNALGWEHCKVDQHGRFELARGEKLAIVSDGITGDHGTDIMSDDELSNHLRAAQDNVEFAAHLLVHVARKRDDRTAIVIKAND